MTGLLGGGALFGAILLGDWLLVWLTPRNPDGTINPSDHLTRRAGEVFERGQHRPSAGNARQPARRRPNRIPSDSAGAPVGAPRMITPAPIGASTPADAAGSGGKSCCARRAEPLLRRRDA